jgi:surfactin synthase thioesterase subunit
MCLVEPVPPTYSLLCVVLQQTRRPYRIIMHGESIGGMVACHVARNYPVDALVCDRTFATLDATAARLMVSSLTEQPT